MFGLKSTESRTSLGGALMPRLMIKSKAGL